MPRTNRLKTSKKLNRNFNWKNFFYGLLIILGVIMLGAFAGWLVGLTPINTRRQLTVKNTVTNMLEGEDHRKIIVQPGYCPNPELTFPLVGQSRVLNYEAINRILDNAKIVTHHNEGPKIALDSSGLKEYEGIFGRSINHQAPSKQEVQRLKNLISYRLDQYSPIAKKFACIFLNDPEADISYHANQPSVFRRIKSMSGFYAADAHSLMLFQNNREYAVAIPREFNRAGSNTWCRKDFNITPSNNSIEAMVNCIMRSFPCMDDRFFSLWQNEIEGVRVLFKKSVAQSDGMQELLDAAAEYEPHFMLDLTKDDLNKLEKHRLLQLGGTINLSDLPKDVMIEVSNYQDVNVRNAWVYTGPKELMNLLSKGNAKLEYIYSHSEFSGVARLEVTAKKLNPNLRLGYLEAAIEISYRYVMEEVPAVNKCSEAFAKMFELKEKTLRLLMPKTLNHIYEQIAVYEEQHQGGDSHRQAMC